jgi:hypothetical protein
MPNTSACFARRYFWPPSPNDSSVKLALDLASVSWTLVLALVMSPCWLPGWLALLEK